MCWNKKVIAGLIGAAAVVYLVWPGSFASALPLLLIAACPLSMLFMMRAMSGGHAADSTNPDALAGSAQELSQLRAEVAELRRNTVAQPQPGSRPAADDRRPG